MSDLYQSAPKRRLISLTPLIDVVFILLVFFMLASSFLDWRVIELNLPTDTDAGAASDDLLIVSIEDNLEMKLNGEPVTDTGLGVRLTERLSNDAELQIQVRTAEGVSLQRSIEILEEITAAGGHNVSLSHLKKYVP